jgi:hypothetical protein
MPASHATGPVSRRCGRFSSLEPSRIPVGRYDQASLSAASRLIKESNWHRLEKNDPLALMGGECQVPGSNPYRVVAETGEHGYKCTCLSFTFLSRKFPSKHTGRHQAGSRRDGNPGMKRQAPDLPGMSLAGLEQLDADQPNFGSRLPDL